MRHPAGQVDHDHRLVRAADALLLFGPQQLRQAQAAHGQAADLEEAAARGAIAIPVLRPQQGEHAVWFLRLPVAARRSAIESVWAGFRAVGLP